MKEGFILSEIIISLALIVFVSLPILNFIFTQDSNRILSTESRTVFKEIPYGPQYVSFSSSTFSSFFSETDIQGYENSDSCDIFFSKILARQSNGMEEDGPGEFNTKPNFLNLYFPQVFADSFASTTNLASTINAVRSDNSQFLLVGANSSSTTDPDLYIYKANFDTEFAWVDSLYLGPGVNDISISSKHVFISERSLSTPLRYAQLSDFLDGIENGAGYARQTLSLIASSTIDHAYPAHLTLSGHFGIVGTEKNNSAEVFIIDLLNNARVGEVEINAGVNSLDIRKNKLYIASPKNPELQIFNFQYAASSSTVNISESAPFDASGSSGNGKSLSVTDEKVFLGRTVGNDELYILRPEELHGSSGAYIAEFMNVNKSIQALRAMHSGRVLVLQTNDPDKAIIFLIDESLAIRPMPGITQTLARASSYQIWFELSLPAPVSDFDCDATRMYIALQSTVQPVAVLSID